MASRARAAEELREDDGNEGPIIGGFTLVLTKKSMEQSVGCNLLVVVKCGKGLEFGRTW